MQAATALNLSKLFLRLLQFFYKIIHKTAQHNGIRRRAAVCGYYEVFRYNGASFTRILPDDKMCRIKLLHAKKYRSDTFKIKTIFSGGDIFYAGTQCSSCLQKYKQTGLSTLASIVFQLPLKFLSILLKMTCALSASTALGRSWYATRFSGISSRNWDG